MGGQGEPQTIAAIGEDAVIALFAGDPVGEGPRLLVANGDDAAAYLSEPGQASVITTDTLVEGVHFDLAYAAPRLVGRKLMAVNLSDLAAMGARPRYALLSVALPGHTPVEVARAIAAGVQEQARAHQVVIIGGNTARSAGPMVLTAVLVGGATPDRLLRRRGARVGDALFVTGRLGDASAGLRVAQRGTPLPSGDHPFAPLVTALLDPTPRVAAGEALGRLGRVRAMCDVSDGLGRDLGRLLAPDGLGARLEAERLPISPGLRLYAAGAGASAERVALGGGEDYELLFAADLADEGPIARAMAEVGTPVTRIGRVTAEPRIRIHLSDGSVIDPPSGYDHFPGG